MIFTLILVVNVCGFYVQTAFSEDKVETRGLLRELLDDVIKDINREVTTTTEYSIFNIFGGGSTAATETTEDAAMASDDISTTSIPSISKTAYNLFSGWFGAAENTAPEKRRRRRGRLPFLNSLKPNSLVNAANSSLLKVPAFDDTAKIVGKTLSAIDEIDKEKKFKPSKVAANDNANKIKSSIFEGLHLTPIIAVENKDIDLQSSNLSTASVLKDKKDDVSAPPDAAPNDSENKRKSIKTGIHLTPTVELKYKDNGAENVQTSGVNTVSVTKDKNNGASSPPNAAPNDVGNNRKPKRAGYISPIAELKYKDNVTENLQTSDLTIVSASKENTGDARSKIGGILLNPVITAENKDTVAENEGTSDPRTMSLLEYNKHDASKPPDTALNEVINKLKSAMKEIQLMGETAIENKDTFAENVQASDLSRIIFAPKNNKDDSTTPPEAAPNHIGRKERSGVRGIKLMPAIPVQKNDSFAEDV